MIISDDDDENYDAEDGDDDDDDKKALPKNHQSWGSYGDTMFETATATTTQRIIEYETKKIFFLFIKYI